MAAVHYILGQLQAALPELLTANFRNHGKRKQRLDPIVTVQSLKPAVHCE